MKWLEISIAALPWYLHLQLVALLALPLVFGVCTRLHDRGYGLTKSIGLILVTYFTWLAAHGLLAFDRPAVLAAMGMLAMLSVAALWYSWRDLLEFLSARWRLVLVQETLFLGAFLAMVLFRSVIPQITYVIGDGAAEKFTDFAVLNSLLASPMFPPHDAWVSGAPLNYYYFGHLLWATLIKLSGVSAGVGFNLGLASIFALACVQAFSLGYNLTRRVGYGFLALFFTVLAGNLDGALQLIGRAAEHGTHFALWWGRYDYWRASRAVENTITEFPAFSLVLGDLHAHLSSLVIFGAGLLLVLQIARGLRGRGSLLHYELRNPGELFLAALLSGAMYAANSWDAITFAAVMAVAFWAGRRAPAAAATNGPWAPPESPIRRVAWRLAQAAEALLLSGVLTLIGSQVLFRPFSRVFQSPLPFHLPEGFPRTWEGLVLPIKQTAESNHTAPVEFVAHWLLLMALPVAVALALAWRAGRGRPSPTVGRRRIPGEVFWGLTALAVATVAVMWAAGAGLTAALLATATVALVVTLLLAAMPPAVAFMLGLMLVFTTLALFCEWWHLDDIFGDGDDRSIERINTVFKIYYGLWPVAAAAMVLASRRAIRWAGERRRRRRALCLLAPLVVLGAAYPVAAPLARLAQTGRPASSEIARGFDALDGMRYLLTEHAGDYAAMQYILLKTPPETRLLEAVGTQYQYSGRMGTNTGRPALGGWLYHSWAWRGASFLKERERRTELARRIYETRSAGEALLALRAEKIELVVVGAQERRQYTELDEVKFTLIADEVLRIAGTTLYQVKKDVDVSTLPVPPAEQRSEPKELSASTDADTDDTITSRVTTIDPRYIDRIITLHDDEESTPGQSTRGEGTTPTL
jgi:YYY domain-containing protein